MKQRFYIDTSVWGGVFDTEFMQETTLLFDMVKKGEVVCLYSDITINELAKAPNKVSLFFESLPDEQKEKVAITPEILRLSLFYR